MDRKSSPVTPCPPLQPEGGDEQQLALSRAALRASEERLRLAIEAGQYGIWDWDVQRNHVAWSDRVYELHGVPPGGFGGRVEDFARLVHPDDVAGVRERIERALQNDEPYAVEFRVPQPDGRIRWLATRAYVVRDDQGRPVRMVGATNDVTDRVELLAAERAAREVAESLALDNARLYAEAEAARHQAETANRAKDEFLAMLGHELRNPLAPIVTALHLMEMRNDQTTASERHIIERQVAHLSRLVDDLLDVSRIAKGKIQLQRERVDLKAVLARALELTQPAFEQRAQPVGLELPAEPATVWGDAVRLAQIFSNLLTNAAKFTPADRRIHVRLRVQSSGIEVAVEDAGCGIAPELLPRVFDLFLQGEQTSDRQAGGLGLGLTIVKTLVQLHGGAVSAASDGEDRGSTFTVRLPATDGAAVISADSESLRSARGSGRLLIVDDNADAAQTLARLLGGAGYDVRTAGDAAGALATLAEFIPHLAVLDIGLPGMDGYALAQELRADPRAAGMRLVALTGYGREPDRARAFAAGFHEHLAKPVATERLLDVLGRLLNQGEPRGEPR